ncbi:hypothetical protein IFM89_030447 [Coptis chinensis]|uniref:Uncharacterized protein n=1 Tax=Coptis chinensis TaxID=261450 RepID=A0A835HA02_9MAGN|nr:hypothetical protein IFM89_030447 [Coptis chinensis]
METFSPGSESPIGCYNASVQELLMIDDLLSALVGIEGRYTSIKRVSGIEVKDMERRGVVGTAGVYYLISMLCLCGNGRWKDAIFGGKFRSSNNACGNVMRFLG